MLGISKEASLESTGLIRYFSIFCISSVEISPERITIFAQRTEGFTPTCSMFDFLACSSFSAELNKDKHCSAESERWSY